MDIFDVLSLVGGLALFLYGMNVMGDGLTKLSGGKMEQILEKLTSTPIKGVLLGAAVTAVIQSSSATTVMVVGFVNSGIMKLSQTVGIIMGANIGTTITSWILSLSGIDGNSIFIQLLKPESFSPVLAIIGVLITMIAKSEKKKDAARILIGFAVLMYGMEAMSAAVEPLQDVPQVASILTMFSNPILGMLVGMVLTAILQSSSASIGILQALCAAGAVTYGSAIPIIMGQNIGTCVTAIISSLDASKNAKRTALIHLYFNAIGTVLFMIVFYLINAFVHFDFLTASASPAGIAVIHSVFNIAATIVLFPFNKLLVKLAYMSVREDKAESVGSEEEPALQRLDPRFLEKPGLAIEHCSQAVVRMSDITRTSMEYAMDLLDEYDEDKAQEIRRMEKKVDHYEDCIGSYLIRIPIRNLPESDNVKISMLLRCISDLERISDYSVNVQSKAKELDETGNQLSFEGSSEILILRGAIKEILHITHDALMRNNLAQAREIEPLNQAIGDLTDEMRGRHIERLKEGQCTMETGIVLEDFITYMERVSGHCSNIGISIIECGSNEIRQHAYTRQLRKNQPDFFTDRYENYRGRYSL